MTKLVIIAARDRNGVIGLNNSLPWTIPEDLAFFKRVTLGAPVIMGRKTHESIGFALPGRENIVITQKASRQWKGCITSTSLEAAIAYCEHHDEDVAYVIGGASIYRQALSLAHKLLITEVDYEFQGDTYFPEFDLSVWLQTRQEYHASTMPPHYPFAFTTYERKAVVEKLANEERLLRLALDGRSYPVALTAFSFTAEKQGPSMTKQYRHPQHILALDKDFTDHLPGMGLTHGFSPITPQEYEEWLEAAGAELVIRQRDGLEANPNYRQILPYTIIAFSDDELANWADIEIFPYQRTKKIGEERLAGNHSIGAGGHPDLADAVFNADSVVNLKETIDTCIQREVGVEELEFTDLDGSTIDPIRNPEKFRIVPMGFIRDDSNNVGRVHLGVVNVIFVKPGTRVNCKEEELITCVPMTPVQLKSASENGVVKLENWSQILVDFLSSSKPTILPVAARKTELDPLTFQHYIVAKQDDKITELAIEFDTTVMRLKRTNLHLFGNELKEGTRINVPTPEHATLVQAEEVMQQGLEVNASLRAMSRFAEVMATVRNSIDSPRNRIVKLTATTLKQVLDSTPDLRQHSIRYMVTTEMYQSLLELEPMLADLATFGVLVICDARNMVKLELDPHDPDPAATVAQFVKDHVAHRQDSLALPSTAPAEAAVVDESTRAFMPMPNPTEEDLKSRVFEALWQEIKSWDVNVPACYVGYCGANGSHVKLLLNALEAAEVVIQTPVAQAEPEDQVVSAIESEL